MRSAPVLCRSSAASAVSSDHLAKLSAQGDRGGIAPRRNSLHAHQNGLGCRPCDTQNCGGDWCAREGAGCAALLPQQLLRAPPPTWGRRLPASSPAQPRALRRSPCRPAGTARPHGIGRAVARAFVRAGFRVLGVDKLRLQDDPAEAAGERCSVFQSDAAVLPACLRARPVTSCPAVLCSCRCAAGEPLGPAYAHVVLDIASPQEVGFVPRAVEKHFGEKESRESLLCCCVC